MEKRSLGLGTMLIFGVIGLALCWVLLDIAEENNARGPSTGPRVGYSGGLGNGPVSDDVVHATPSRTTTREEHANGMLFYATIDAANGPGGWDDSGGEIKIVMRSESARGSGAFVATTTSGSWSGELATGSYSIVGVGGTETSYELLDAESLSPGHPVAVLNVVPRQGWFIDVVDGLTGLSLDKPFDMISDPSGSSGRDAIILPDALQVRCQGRTLVDGPMAMRAKYLVKAEGYASEVVWHSFAQGDVVVEVAPVADLTLELSRACEIDLYHVQRNGEPRLTHHESYESVRKQSRRVVLADIPAGRYLLYSTFETSGVLRAELDVLAGRMNHTVVRPDPAALASLEIALDLPAAGRITSESVSVRRRVRLGDRLDPKAVLVEGGWRAASPQRRESLRDWDETVSGRRWSRRYDKLIPGEYRFDFEPLGISKTIDLQPGDRRVVSIHGDSLKLVNVRLTGWPVAQRPESLITVYRSSQHGSHGSLAPIPSAGDSLAMWMSQEPALVITKGSDVTRWCRLNSVDREVVLSYEESNSSQTIDVSFWRGGLPVPAGNDAMIGVSPVGHDGACTSVSFSSRSRGTFRITVTSSGDYLVRTVGLGIGRSDYVISVVPVGADHVTEIAIPID